MLEKGSRRGAALWSYCATHGRIKSTENWYGMLCIITVMCQDEVQVRSRGLVWGDTYGNLFCRTLGVNHDLIRIANRRPMQNVSDD